MLPQRGSHHLTIPLRAYNLSYGVLTSDFEKSAGPPMPSRSATPPALAPIIDTPISIGPKNERHVSKKRGREKVRKRKHGKVNAGYKNLTWHRELPTDHFFVLQEEYCGICPEATQHEGKHYEPREAPARDSPNHAWARREMRCKPDAVGRGSGVRMS